MSFRKKIRYEIENMLENDEVSVQEAAFMYGYYLEDY